MSQLSAHESSHEENKLTDERIEQISKHLAYVLRHRYRVREMIKMPKKQVPRPQPASEGASESPSSSPLTPISEQEWCFSGGWFDLDYLLDQTKDFDHAKSRAQGDRQRVISEIRETVARSVGQRVQDKRFQIAELDDGRVLVKANYHHSFDIDDALLPKAPHCVPNGGSVKIPSLQMLCVRQITANIDLYENIGDIGDPFVLRALWHRLLKLRMLNNSRIRKFASEFTTVMQLGRVSKVVTASTLRHIVMHCPNLEVLGLEGCQALNEQLLAQMTKKCPRLTHLSLRDSVVVQPSWLQHIGKLPNLESIDLRGCQNVSSEEDLSQMYERLKGRSIRVLLSKGEVGGDLEGQLEQSG